MSAVAEAAAAFIVQEVDRKRWGLRARGAGRGRGRCSPAAPFHIQDLEYADRVLETGAASDAGFQQRYDLGEIPPRGLVAGDLAAGPDAGERIPALGGVVLPGAGPSCGGGGDANPALPAGLRQRGHLQRARQLRLGGSLRISRASRWPCWRGWARRGCRSARSTWRPCGGSWCWTRARADAFGQDRAR